MDASVGEMAGKVTPLRAAPLHHGGGGIIESVEGGSVILLPAVVPERAGAAYPAGGSVKDGGYVIVILRGTEGGAQGVAQGTEGLGCGLQLMLDQGLGPQVHRAGHLGSQPHAQLAHGPLGQQEKGSNR